MMEKREVPPEGAGVAYCGWTATVASRSEARVHQRGASVDHQRAAWVHSTPWSEEE